MVCISGTTFSFHIPRPQHMHMCDPHGPQHCGLDLDDHCHIFMCLWSASCLPRAQLVPALPSPSFPSLGRPAVLSPALVLFSASSTSAGLGVRISSVQGTPGLFSEEQLQLKWRRPNIQCGRGPAARPVSPGLVPGWGEVTFVLPTATSCSKNGLRLPNPHPLFSAQIADSLQPVVNCQKNNLPRGHCCLNSWLHLFLFGRSELSDPPSACLRNPLTAGWSLVARLPAT